MDSRAAYAAGVATGVVLTGFALASAAPRLSAYVVRLAARELLSFASIPLPLLDSAVAPAERRVFNLVRGKVAPWVSSA